MFRFDIEYDHQKEVWLKHTRGISFLNVIDAITCGAFHVILIHPNRVKYRNQSVLAIQIDNYMYVVPFVLDNKRHKIFLKTVYPSRKLTKKYLSHDK